ncbi:MAG TPA: hypothetical protein VF230_10500 [Acidimicrobiales bacterium]
MTDASDLEPAAAPTRDRIATRALSATIAALLVAGAVAAVVVSGSSAPKVVPLATIQAAAESATAAKTATVEVTMTIESASFNSTTRMIIRTDNVARTADFHTASDFGGTKRQQTEGRIAGDRFVLRVPAELADISAGKPWLGANVPANAFGSPEDPMRTGGNLLDLLAGANGAVDVVGTDKIRGVDTTHYRVEIDMVRAQQANAAGQSALGFPTPPVVEGPATRPADVWLDDEGRLRRMVMTFDDDGPGPEPGMRAQSEAYDYDKPFTVTMPPADQVHEVPTIGDAFTALYTRYATDLRPPSP